MLAGVSSLGKPSFATTVDGNQKSGVHQFEVGSLSDYLQGFIHPR